MSTQTYRVVAAPKLKRDYVGRMVRTKTQMGNGWGIIPEGMIGEVVRQSPKGSEIRFQACECCGLRATISRVSQYDIEFIEQE